MHLASVSEDYRTCLQSPLYRHYAVLMKKLLSTLPFVLLFAACASTPPTGAPPPSASPPAAVPQAKEYRTFNMVSQNFSFSPASLSMAKGTMVTLKIQNSGLHTFTIDALRINQNLASGTNTVMFTATQSGTFEYYCAIPGHRERGMVGTLQVL